MKEGRDQGIESISLSVGRVDRMMRVSPEPKSSDPKVRSEAAFNFNPLLVRWWCVRFRDARRTDAHVLIFPDCRAITMTSTTNVPLVGEC